MKISAIDNFIEFESGYQEIEIDSKNEVNLNLKGLNKSNVFLKIVDAKKININYEGLSGSDVTLLIWNESKNDLDFIEKYKLLNDSNLKLAYGDLGASGFIRDTFVDLSGKGSSALVKSASLVKSRKHYNICVLSSVPYTSGDIENYSVVLENGDYKMDATGKIAKGAYKSSSHQTSRALCLSDKQTSFIQPNLMIDENDVLASHATSLGRIDESQMVYMQSRGLRINEIMALISFGYLLPIADMIENDQMRDRLKQSIESKVSNECLM